MIGDTVSHYRVIQQLGAGGMGVVYEAEDVRLHRRVALKFLADDATNDSLALERFRREAEAASALNHPHICTIYDIDAHEGRPFIVMEKLSGTTLTHLIANAPLRVDRIVSIGSQIADALNAAHAAGIIHRDIKPANIFITERGDAKLLDFGLARLADRPVSPSADTEPDERPENLTRPGTTLGTIAYMSPEQARGETVDPRSDLFSLGGVLYEMATGVQPFRGGTIPSIAAAILTDEVPPPSRSNPEIPQQLDHVILGALEKDRELRVQSAAALRAELLRVGRDSSPQIAAPPRRRVGWTAAAVGALAVTVAIAVSLLLPQRRSPAPRPREVHSILVLPFDNQSHDPNSEYLSDGIAEGLISTLAALPNVRVVARTTAFRFKEKPLDLQQIRKQLDVDAVVAGRLLHRANDTIVQADLIDTASGTELWGTRIHESNADVMNIEQQLVQRISDALRLHLTPAEQTRFAQQSTHNSEAYKLYLQGRFYWNKRTAESIVKARDFFTQAIAIDPQFGLAYTGLADACNMLGITFRVLTPEEGFRCAQDAAQTALRLEPGLAEAHASLGLIYNNRFRWAPAEKEFKRALELNPNYSNALLWYAGQLLARNQLNESLAMMRRAEQIDPLSAIVVANVAMRLNSLEDFRAALPEAQKAIELDPRYEPAWWQVGLAYEGLGNRVQAIETYRRGVDASSGPPGTREAMLIRLNMLRGNVEEAKRLARLLEARADRGEVAQAIVGWGYSAIGDHDKTFFWLNRGLAAREPALRDNRVKYSDVRDDPRFAELTNGLARGFDD